MKMKKVSKIIKTGPLKGKKIVFASTAGIDVFKDILEDFIKKIFNFDPGDYLVSDESSLHDFTGVDDIELVDIQKKIQDIYNIDVSDIKSGNLLEIIVRINSKYMFGKLP